MPGLSLVVFGSEAWRAPPSRSPLVPRWRAADAAAASRLSPGRPTAGLSLIHEHEQAPGARQATRPCCRPQTRGACACTLIFPLARPAPAAVSSSFAALAPVLPHAIACSMFVAFGRGAAPFEQSEPLARDSIGPWPQPHPAGRSCCLGLCCRAVLASTPPPARAMRGTPRRVLCAASERAMPSMRGPSSLCCLFSFCWHLLAGRQGDCCCCCCQGRVACGAGGRSAA